jgi:parallel beta-helix repeat protein
MPTRTRLAAAVAPIAAFAALAFAPAAANADSTCTKFASTSGSDSASGSVDAPYRTAQQLADSLGAGDTGCLRGGTYVEDLKVDHAGRSGAPLTITSYPGERAKIVGRVWVTRNGDFVTMSNLDMNGTTARGTNRDNLPSPTVNGASDSFTGNDVTNDHHTICFAVGGPAGPASKTVIDGNRIHNCGILPAANHDHGIYVVTSSDAEITNNLIYDNADRGVQLYPAANRTHIAGNVIDGNGQGILFSGDDGTASNDNVVEDNIISNSNVRSNVESYYPANNPIGHGNVVRNNCIGGGVRDNGNGAIDGENGFKVERNNVIVRAPKFADRNAKDFGLQAGSPCAGIAKGATRTAGDRAGTTEPTVAAPVATPTTSTNRSDQPSVSVKTTRSGRGVVRMRGRVHRGRGIRSAAVTPTHAVVQIRWAGSWYPLKALRLHNGRFDSHLHIPATLRGRVITLRVVVPKLAKSRAVHVRTRR